ncbi:hypothetical protein [Mammaliicoccus sciuri]|uniref:hypothetical protein n=1 Tax=Mammaliicoccus sciuri TaxID=1296 RepID=UPI003F57932E
MEGSKEQVELLMMYEEIKKERDQYMRERDELIKDVEKLREEKVAKEMYLDAVKVYKPMYEEVNKKYTNLTEHIRLKANNNPGNSRYIALVHFIDDLEADTHEG